MCKDESHKIMGACVEVYNEKGSGFVGLCIRSALPLNWDSRAFLSRNKLDSC